MSGQRNDRSRREDSAISPLEWVAVTVAAAIVCGALATLLVHAARPRTPPDLVVAVEGVDRVSAGFLVRFTVENRGGSTAAQVIVRGASRGPDGSEEPEVVFDYVPDGSKRHGGLLFAHDPRPGTLAVRAIGYREP